MPVHRASPPRRPRPSRRGANAIEFALLFPVFVVLLAGLIDYGFLFMVQSILTHAVHEAVRTGAVTLAADDPVAAATAAVQPQLDASGVSLATPTVTATLGGTAPNRFISLSISVPVDAPVTLVPVPATISATAIMRLEDQSG